MQSVAASLSEAVEKGLLFVGARRAVAVCLAMPQQTPREIHRKNILRIELIGEGVTAEVFKNQISEPERGSPAYLVAVKAAKAAVGASHDDLLEEAAALLALLSHRNVLPLVGVVTIPRDLPPLVLLQFCEKGTLKERVANAGDGGISTVSLPAHLLRRGATGAPVHLEPPDRASRHCGP